MFGWHPAAPVPSPEQGKIVLAMAVFGTVGGVGGYYVAGAAGAASGVGVAIFLLAVGYHCLTRPALQTNVVVQGNVINVAINLPPEAPLLSRGTRNAG